jgi:arylsulfatase A-like enzyme
MTWKQGLVLAALGALGLAAILTFGRPPARPDLVLVVLDTVREDFTGVPGSGNPGRSSTPHLDALAAEGVTFSHAFSTAPWTVPAHASLFTGLFPARHGCTTRRPRLSDDVPTLAAILTDAGYETAAFFSNPWLDDGITGLLRGFESRVASGLAGDPLESADQGGKETVERFGAWLDGRRRPFFAFVNLLEAHLPYVPPARFRAPEDSGGVSVGTQWSHGVNAGVISPDSAEWARARRLYAGDVSHADALLGELVEALRRRGAYEDAVILVTSDHGENLGEHGLADHQFCVYETLLAVPLVVRAPGRLAPGVRREPVMLSDVFATVLDLAGLARRRPEIARRSLARERPEDPERPVIAQYAGASAALLAPLERLNPELDESRLTPALVTVRRGKWRLTVGSDGSRALHDLSADPGQERDLSAAEPQVVAALYPLAVAATSPPPEDQGVAAPLNDELRAALRALGYVE